MRCLYPLLDLLRNLGSVVFQVLLSRFSIPVNPAKRRTLNYARGLLVVFPFLAFSVPAPPNRLPSTPFITGDTFRFFADYAYDELDTSLDPKKIEPGNTIFVKTDYLGDFFQKIHPYIDHRYILISHNSDDSAPGKYAEFLKDKKLMAWFAQNYDGYPDAKMHPIPIGIANFHWKHGNFREILNIQKNKPPKTHLAYLNITVQTFSQERSQVARQFSKKNYCRQKTAQTYKNFLNDIAASYFVISPRGNGLDTHRIWETLYLGSVPIVKSSSLDRLYEGLPILIVSDWDEITENFLRKQLQNYPAQKETSNKLFINYWINQIKQLQNGQPQENRRFESNQIANFR